MDKQWFHLVICLRADTKTIARRLEARGYEDAKIRENIECEIFRVVDEELEEMMAEAASRKSPKLLFLENDSADHLEKNLSRIWRESLRNGRI